MMSSITDPSLVGLSSATLPAPFGKPLPSSGFLRTGFVKLRIPAARYFPLSLYFFLLYERKAKYKRR
jgi:hypothetical protein